MKKYSTAQIITIIISSILILISAGVISFYYFTKDSAPETSNCVIQECHGPYYSCGEPQQIACTQEFRLGDMCNQFATCEAINNTCKLKENPKLAKCQECVKECSSFECVERCTNNDE